MSPALEFLQLCDLLHRDVSSGNILLNEVDSKGCEAGFLHDLEYCSLLVPDQTTTPAEIAKSLKDMTVSIVLLHSVWCRL